MFFTRAARRQAFLWHKQDGAITASRSWRGVEQVASLAAGLKAIGIQPGDRVMLVAENRPGMRASAIWRSRQQARSPQSHWRDQHRTRSHPHHREIGRAPIVSNAKLARTLLPQLSATQALMVTRTQDRAPGDMDFHSRADRRSPDQPRRPRRASDLQARRYRLHHLLHQRGTGGRRGDAAPRR